jgi:hypothetical protein
LTSMTPDEARQAQEARQVDLDTWRDGHPDTEPRSVAQVLDDQARNRSQLDPPFAAAWSLVSAGFAVVPCNPSGRPLAGAEAVNDAARLMAAWDQHPHAVAAAACGSDHDLVALAVDDDGSEWLAQVAIDPATRRNPGPAKPEATSTPFGGYEEPNNPRPGPWRRELGGTTIRLIEAVAPVPRMAAAATGPGDRAQSWGEDLAAKLRRPKPTSTIWLAWAWPLPENGKVWTLPTGRRVRAGVELRPAIPVDGAVLELGGKRFQVSWGSGLGRRLPLPSWLAIELGGRLRAS